MSDLDRVRRAIDPGYRQEQEARDRSLREQARRQAAANELLRIKNSKLTIDRLLLQADPEELDLILRFLIENRGECPTCGTKIRPPEASDFDLTGSPQNLEEEVYRKGGEILED